MELDTDSDRMAAERIARGRAMRLRREQQQRRRAFWARTLRPITAPAGRALKWGGIAFAVLLAWAVLRSAAEAGSQALCSGGVPAVCPLARYLAEESARMERENAAADARRRQERALELIRTRGISAAERVRCRSRLDRLTGLPAHTRILSSPEQQQQSGVIPFSVPDGRGGERLGTLDCRAWE